MFFYTENKTHIWDDNNMYGSIYMYRKSDIFPLVLFPFEQLCLPVPKHIRTVLDMSYNVDLCVTSVYSHKYERISNKRQITIPCKRLFPWYPFVFEINRNSIVQRKLLLSDSLIYEEYFFLS